MARRLVFCLIQAPLAILATGVLSLLATLGGLFSPAAVDRLSRFWGRLLLRLFRIEIVTRGAENVPPGPALYAANHSSSLDILIVLAYLPVDVRIIYKKSLSLVPLLGWSIWLGEHIPIDRSNPFRARRSLARAAARIRAGTSVLAFPEGTRSPDGVVRHFKRGSFGLAIDAGVPVVPLSLVGVKRLVPNGLFSTRPGRIDLVVHPAIPVTNRKADDAQALAEEARSVVAAGCEGGTARE